MDSTNEPDQIPQTEFTERQDNGDNNQQEGASYDLQDVLSEDEQTHESANEASSKDSIMEPSRDGLESLGVTFVKQSALENQITKKADAAMLAKDEELDQKRLDKANQELKKVLSRLTIMERKLKNRSTKLSEKAVLKKDIAWLVDNDLRSVQSDISDIKGRIKERSAKTDSIVNLANGNTSEQLPSESKKDYLIRTGKITAFGNENSFAQGESNDAVSSHRFLRAPGFADDDDIDIEVDADDNDDEYHEPLASKKRKLEDDEDLSMDESDFELSDEGTSKKSNTRKMKKSQSKRAKREERNTDDGDELSYQTRLRSWTEKRSRLREKHVADFLDDPTQEEWNKPHPTIPDAILNDEFRIPGDIYPSLFDYQKTCVQWLWELYSQKTGGIVGDEMGLGKTVQMISFLAGLHYSGLLTKPILVVCPATVMNQWVNEFHRWWPPMRTIILHNIGSGMNIKIDEDKLERLIEMEDSENASKSIASIKTHANAKEIVDRVVEKGHVLITTYVGLRIYSKYILPKEWGYVVLDEGHKIRNPDSDISLTCKQLKTHNRVILSGTPIQNNLIELWSLFDFVFPGRLGTLPVFQLQFSHPINVGGYANASNVQVQTGYKCAVILRDLISPYLLRRVKSDVAQDLPKKNEMVLFCKLTQYQQDKYEQYLNSADIASILKGKRNVLLGVDILRKICNHPDLAERDILMHKPNYNYGAPHKSGKMQVVKALLELWKKEGHRTLLFAQTRQMLDILQKFISRLDGFQFLRMDGSTNIAQRQSLVDTFNEDLNFHVFLLTTKVGGLGINLTGANRVIIYDPDWNPSTDIQARERAWRLGQKKDVTIYRLMTAGSIEEKIYHRQIFKQFLTNKILKDPKQRRFFKMNDLHDLFTLGDPEERGTETGDMFNGTEYQFKGKKERVSKKLIKTQKNDDDFYQVAEMSGVSKLENFQGDPVEHTDEDSSKAEENRIMQGLFSSSGVHSALEHDAIMDSSIQESSIVEREASRIAADAAKALRLSRKVTRANAIGTPTWTGKSGQAGRFGPKLKRADGTSSSTSRVGSTDSSRAGTPISSSSILSKIKEKREMDKKRVSSIFSSRNNDLLSNDDLDNKKELIERVVNYMQKSEDNFAKSSEILISLNLKMSSQKDMATVRSMLREVAKWDAEKKGWTLKNDFK